METLSTKCPNHPNGPVTFTCARCGTFGCDACKSPLAGPLCSACGARVASAGLRVVETFQESLQFLMQRPRLIWAYVAAYAVYGMVLYPFNRFAHRTAEGGGIGELAVLLPTLGLVVVVATIFSTAAEVILIRYIGDQLEGQERPVGDTVRAALERLLPSIGSNILVGLAVGLGTLMCIVPGILLAVPLSLAIPAVVLHGAGAVGSLSASWARTGGNRLNLFLLLLICGVIVLALGLVAATFRALVTPLGGLGELLTAMVGQAVSGLSLCLILAVLVFSDLKLSGQWIRTSEPS